MSTGAHGGYFKDDRHALYTGVVIASLMLAGSDVKLVDDGLGNWMPLITFVTPRGEFTLSVQPPPAEWKLSDSVPE
jgi:hypothetical protein